MAISSLLDIGRFRPVFDGVLAKYSGNTGVIDYGSILQYRYDYTRRRMASLSIKNLEARNGLISIGYAFNRNPQKDRG